MTEASNEPLLELSGVNVRFGGRRSEGDVQALRDLDLTIRPGERLAIVGRSGVGKSTVARVAFGLVAPTAGQVRVGGVDLASRSRAQLRGTRRRMHLIFQDPYQSLHPGMSVLDAVSEPLAIAGTDRAQRTERALAAIEEVGLFPVAELAGRYPGALSGGQRQRVAIARALVARPELIIADEPTSMLDASIRAVIVRLLLHVQEKFNAAVLFITHDLALARHMGDSIAVMHDGRIVEQRPSEELIADPAHPATEELLTAARFARSRA